MARSNDYEYNKLKGSPGSGRTSDKSGPKDTNKLRTDKRMADYCGIADSRAQNSDRRQSAK